jgi:hypothetical protein
VRANGKIGTNTLPSGSINAGSGSTSWEPRADSTGTVADGLETGLAAGLRLVALAGGGGGGSTGGAEAETVRGEAFACC